MKELLEYYISLATTEDERVKREKMVEDYLAAMIMSAGMQYEMQIEGMVNMKREAEAKAKERTIEVVQPTG